MVAPVGLGPVVHRPLHVVLGKVRDEAEFLFAQCKNAARVTETGTNFEYHLGPMPICRDAFMQILGLPLLNTRFLGYETMLRQGINALPLYEPHPKRSGSKQEMCKTYIHAYVMVHGEKSPSNQTVLLTKQAVVDVFNSYRAWFKNAGCVKKSTFKKL